MKDRRGQVWTLAERERFASEGAPHFVGADRLLALGRRCKGSGQPLSNGCCSACGAPFCEPGIHAEPGSADAAVAEVMAKRGGSKR